MAKSAWKSHTGARPPVPGHTLVDVYYGSVHTSYDVPAYTVCWALVKQWRLTAEPPKDPAPAMPVPTLDELQLLRTQNATLKTLWREAAANEERYFAQLEAIRKIAA